MLLTVLKQVGFLYVFIFIGWLFGTRNKHQGQRVGLLSFLLVNLFLPCKVFYTFSNKFTVEYITDKYPLLLCGFGLLAVFVLISTLIGNKLTKEDYHKKVYKYTIVISSYAYMGYALAESLLGLEGLADFIMFCIPFTLYIYTYGYAMLTGGEASLKKVINPMTVAILLGMIFGLLGITLPELATSVLSGAAACMSPVSMLLTGMTLATFSIKELVADKTSYLVMALRLVALPVLTFLIFLLPGLEAYRSVAVLYACLPCGLNTVVFPRLVDEDCRPGARLAFLSHLFSCLTIPVCMALLG